MITVGLYGISDPAPGPVPTGTHDHGVAILRGGRVETVVQLERWTGRKHDNRLGQYIGEILDAVLPEGEAIRFVSVNSFAGDEFRSADGRLWIRPRAEVPISANLVPAEVEWAPHGGRRRPVEGWVISHEAAHLYSLLPFVGTFEEGALAAHIDGGASRSSSSFWRIHNGHPVLESSSWDELKASVNLFNDHPLSRVILGLPAEAHLAMPGRLMGLAGHGEPHPHLREWLEDVGWMAGASDAFAHETVAARFGRPSTRSPACQAIAATMQARFQQAVSEAVLKRKESSSTLYFAGGAALNIPTNAALQQHFSRVWVPPCPNDTGLSLGAAACVEYLDHGRLPVHTAFLNQFDRPPDLASEALVEHVSGALLCGEVVGVCSGAGEVGPRALGHRSILARTDRPEVRIRTSETIKRREWYRPVAPVMCEAAARAVLSRDAMASPLSRWMLGAWPVAPDWRDALRGVLHADGTIRAQVVRPGEGNDWLHALLTRLWELHGLPALINTSFNGPGQPIVQREGDARRTAAQLGLDGVVVNGSLHRP